MIAGGFRDSVSGIAAGLLVKGHDVFYTCIPHLWVLHDNTGDGVADLRVALSSGYGVNIAMLGHDLHGLRIGPDGRLYFSSGDRGFHVKTENGVIESFNGKLRDECLNANWFETLDDARGLIESWRTDYNEQRPHSALGNVPPAQYLANLIEWASP